MLNEILFPKIEGEDIGNIWFQQDGATLDVLCPVFEDRITSRRADVVCPPSELQFDTVGLLFVRDAAIWMKLFSFINRKDCTFK